MTLITAVTVDLNISPTISENAATNQFLGVLVALTIHMYVIIVRMTSSSLNQIPAAGNILLDALNVLKLPTNVKIVMKDTF